MAKKLWNKDFVLMLQARAVSTLGDLMYSVAIGYWVYTQTGSSALMGIMSSISMFVTMFLSPFCGSIVDKCNRKWVIVAIDVIQGLLMLGIGALAYWNALNVPAVLAVALLAAFGSVLYSPATETLMLDIIPREDMVRGQSVSSGVVSLIDLAGSAFSGVMVAFFGVPLIVVINGLSNLYSAASAMFVRVPRTVHQGEQVTVSGVFKDSWQAVKTIFSQEHLRVFVPCALIINLLAAGPLALVLPLCLGKGFTVDMYGYVISIFTLASLVCVLLLGIFKLKPKARLGIMTVGFVFSTFLFMGAYLSQRFWAMCIFVFLAGAANTAGNTIFNASFVLALPEENRSAILGFFRAATVGGTALSTLIYGFLGDVFPLHLVAAVGCVVSLAPMLYLCLHPKTRGFILSH